MRRVLVTAILVMVYLFFLAILSWGAVFCVSTPAELQAALTASETNLEDDIIKVIQGTYNGNFTYNSNKGHSITLLGGYTSGCASRETNPSNTILDGGGSDRVLYFKNSDGGNIYIEGFTIQNGITVNNGGGVYASAFSLFDPIPYITINNNIIAGNQGNNGGGVYASASSDSGTSGGVAITNNAITINTASNKGGGIYASLYSLIASMGDIIIANNIIIGNNASYNGQAGGGVYASSSTSGGTASDITIVNNIVVGNIATGSGEGGGIYASSYGSMGLAGDIAITNNTISVNTANSGGGLGLNKVADNSIDVYNNIIWGNMALTGIDIFLDGTGVANGYNNDYSNMSGSWTNSGNNINENPQFIGSSNYHLQSDSPCIDVGINSAPELPDTDFEGDPRIIDGDNNSVAIVDMGADEYDPTVDLLGTWDGSGVWCRNSVTGSWVKMASPATQITAGDIDGDGTDDLLGIWPGQGGVWVKYSSTSSWSLLSSTADWIAAGDMNGDGRCDLLGTWIGQGVYYRNSDTGTWVKMSSPATQIAAGDIDGDGTDDLLGIWPSQGGVWVKYSSSSTWALLSSTADWIAAGDMNGDGRDDLLGTWSSQGVYYRDSDTGSWVKMATPASQITAGDIDGDGTDDLLGIWPSQGGVWVKYSSDGTWERLSSTADWIASGKMRSVGGTSIEGFMELPAPIGGYAEGPGSIDNYVDLSSEGPGGWNFVFQEEENLVPKEKELIGIMRIHGPGEPGFRYIEQKNLFPQERIEKKNNKIKRK